MRRIGVVVIGRNEDKRLGRCIASIRGSGLPAVYVDSGSTDRSVETARAMNWDVVELDPLRPFTAARARNEGFEHLLRACPDIEFVQFVDGDSELVEGWLKRAEEELADRADVDVVCGRLRERHPEASVYNRLCDMEWNTPIGVVQSSGGIFAVRVEAFRRVGGFNPAMIAGEEAELCLRLRDHGGKIVRLGADMAWHDAAMTRFGQWWKRAVRSGHAYAEGAWRHGYSTHRHNVREVRSVFLWGMLVPALAIGLALHTSGWSLLLLGMFVVQVARVRRHRIALGDAPGDANLYAIFCSIGKFPMALGMLLYVWRQKLLGRPGHPIEHKGPGAVTGSPSSRDAAGAQNGSPSDSQMPHYSSAGT